MVTIVGVQAPSAHPTGMDDQRREEVDGPVPDIFELASLNLAGAHPSRRTPPFQDLEVGHLIEADHELPTGREGRGVLITPENRRCPCAKARVERGSFPIARAMGLKVGGPKDQRDGRVGDPRHDPTCDRDDREAALRPVGNVQTQTRRITAGEPFDLDADQGGKASAVGQTGARRRAPPGPRPRSAGKPATPYCDPRQGVPPGPRRRSQDRTWPAGYAHVGRPAEAWTRRGSEPPRS